MFCGAKYTHHTFTQFYGKLQWNTELFAKMLTCTALKMLVFLHKFLVFFAVGRGYWNETEGTLKWDQSKWDQCSYGNDVQLIGSEKDPLYKKKQVFVVVFTVNLKKHIYLTNTFWLFSSSYHSNSHVSIVSTFWMQLYVHWNILYTISPQACSPLSSTQT